MKILLISDTHGNNQICEFLHKKYPKMDLYLHAGDFQSDPYSLFPFEAVKGNCDYFVDVNERFLTDTPYGKLLMMHTPNVPFYLLKKEGIKIFVHGHTHKRRFEKIDDIYFINPGSTCLERDGFENGYAIVDIEKDEVKVTFCDI